MHACAGPGRAKHCPLGCGLLGSPNTGKDDRIRNYSRPGPKSGVGSNLAITLILLQSQLSRSVRVPALSVGAGEGNPSAYSCRHSVPKPNGIQVINGKQEPTHNWSRYVKRSFKRACHRAIKHGQASYKGRTLTVTNSSPNQPPTTFTTIPRPHQPKRRLQVYCRNVGGLGSGMYEDLMEFLDQSHYDIVLIQETKLRRVHDSHMDMRRPRHHCSEACWCHDTHSALYHPCTRSPT